MTNTIPNHMKVRRVSYALLALLLLGSVVFEAAKHATGYWLIGVFAIAPDLTLLFGAGPSLERAQLHPRAVRCYNLVHRFWGPATLILLAAANVLEIGGLTWAFHIALDRSLGYGLRTPDGFQRD